jgi:iron(III) transport system ATP-binding protein
MSNEEPQKPWVRVRDLTKVYHTRRGEVVALRGVSLDIVEGEILVLLGPSGCGKTSLLRCVAGLEHPTSGEITVHGRTVYSSEQGISIPPEQRKLSMVFQSYALWPHMTVFQNVSYPLKISRVRDAEIRDRVHNILVLAGLEKLAANYPGQLSGGQQQRVALARALVANDGLILFDEPLSNLDAKVRERLRDELISMQQRFGFTAIYVTHDQVEAAALGHRIAVMEVGEVAQLGSPTEIFNIPGSRHVADFVGCTNELVGTVAGSVDGLLQVDTPIGRLLGAPALPAPGAGQPVRVMFRPEHCRVSGRDSGGANTFTARVQQSFSALTSSTDWMLRGNACCFARWMVSCCYRVPTSPSRSIRRSPASFRGISRMLHSQLPCLG